MELIRQYFTLSEEQYNQLAELSSLYQTLNARVNVISRKDIDNIYERHVLHSLSIAQFCTFPSGSSVLDFGTGGGFPGIPLSIIFPEVQFCLIDSIAKKISVVQAVIDALELTNVKARHTNVKQHKEHYHYIVTRAVASFPMVVALTKKNLQPRPTYPREGLICLKGGDLREELAGFQTEIHPLNSFFSDSFFETKKIVYCSTKSLRKKRT